MRYDHCFRPLTSSKPSMANSKSCAEIAAATFTPRMFSSSNLAWPFPHSRTANGRELQELSWPLFCLSSMRCSSCALKASREGLQHNILDKSPSSSPRQEFLDNRL